MKANLLNAYYRFEKTTSKNRLDCVEATNNHLYLNQKFLNKIGFNKGRFSMLFNANEFDFDYPNLKSTISISRNGQASYLKLYDISEPNIFYGYLHGTNDAIIMKVMKDAFNDVVIIELYISIGNKKIASDICYEFISKALEPEVEKLKLIVIVFDYPDF